MYKSAVLPPNTCIILYQRTDNHFKRLEGHLLQNRMYTPKWNCLILGLSSLVKSYLFQA